MSENDLPKTPKRFKFTPTAPVQRAVRKLMADDGFATEGKAIEYLVREGLTQRSLLTPIRPITK